jgi:hypothetical protein
VLLLLLLFKTPTAYKTQVSAMETQLRENQVILRTSKSSEDCALIKLQQVEFERDSLKTHHEHSKVLLKSLEAENKTLDNVYRDIEKALKEKIEENVMLNLDLDSVDQKVNE